MTLDKAARVVVAGGVHRRVDRRWESFGSWRTSGYFVSAHEYAELQRLRALERRAYRITELPTEIARAIETAAINPAHDHLNDLLKEQK